MAETRSTPAERATEQSGPDPTAESQRAFVVLLFNKYRGALLRHVERLVRSREDAAELVQDTYMRVMDTVEASRFEAAARAYLFQTATNLARDHHRRQRHRAHERLDELSEAELPVGEPPPDQRIAAEQVLERLRGALVAMPETTRTVFLMARMERRGYAEIARELGLSVRTVERRMAEAMTLLVARLKEFP